jgi:hypothetical protein
LSQATSSSAQMSKVIRAQIEVVMIAFETGANLAEM